MTSKCWIVFLKKSVKKTNRQGRPLIHPFTNVCVSFLENYKSLYFPKMLSVPTMSQSFRFPPRSWSVHTTTLARPLPHPQASTHSTRQSAHTACIARP